MKKIKMLLMSVTVIAAISGAYATKPVFQCDSAIQYYWDGSAYVAAGTYGLNYDCYYTAGSTCTYYRPNPVTQPSVFVACKPGDFILIGGLKAK